MSAPARAGTQRRLQALMARAWSPGTIERVTGVQASVIRRALGDDRSVTPDLAAAVIAAYDRLWDKQPPRDTSRGVKRPRGPQVLDHPQHQASPRLQESRSRFTITGGLTGLLTSFQGSASDTQTRFPRYLSCVKARPAVSTASANCRKVQHAADLQARLAEHEAGRGARLLQVAREAGITWTLARTWPGDRKRERQLKAQGSASRCCPECGITPALLQQLSERNRLP